jgi:hypothetical protein
MIGAENGFFPAMAGDGLDYPHFIERQMLDFEGKRIILMVRFRFFGGVLRNFWIQSGRNRGRRRMHRGHKNYRRGKSDARTFWPESDREQ